MTSRPDLSTDDVIRRLEALPAEVWEPPAPPPLRLHFGSDTAAAPAEPASAPPVATAPVPATRHETRRGLREWLSESFTLRPLTAGALAGVLLLVGLAGGFLLGGRDGGGSPDAEVRLAALPGAPQAKAVAFMGGSLDGMELKADGLPASKPGEYYELWALNTAQDLAPIGTFRVGADGKADVRFALGIDPARYKALDVSVEREDGNPGHSGDSLLRSSTSKA